MPTSARISLDPTAPHPAGSSHQWATSPVIEYEPQPAPISRGRRSVCATPAADAGALHPRPDVPPRRPRHPVHPIRPPLHLCDPPPPKSAAIFAETALRQVIEVIDRRRPIAQLRPLMTPALVDRVIARAGSAPGASATMQRVRVRSVHAGGGAVTAAEVFASFTRSGRVHAIAARIERYRDRWRLVALQIG